MRILILSLLAVIGCSSTSTNETPGSPTDSALDDASDEKAQNDSGADIGSDATEDVGDAPEPVDTALDAPEDAIGPDAADAACSDGATHCSGTNLETCVKGSWQFTQTCPYVCSNNACGGSCVPGSKSCVAQTPRTCGTNGEWVYSAPCPYTCMAGDCKGLCNPGALKCGSVGVEKCGTDGLWHPEQTCPYVCVDPPGMCSGVCKNGATQCNGLQTQFCNPLGQWTTTGTCPFACSNGSCTGVCTPTATKCVGNGTQTCNSLGQWGSTVACPYLCSAGACTGVCTPGTTKCNGTNVETCSASGQWVVSQTCPNVPNGTAKCVGTGTCSFDCTSGYADCNASAGCETQLGTTSNCKSCGDVCSTGGPNTQGICTSQSQGCTTSCFSGFADCDGILVNGCEDNLQSVLNCGACGKKCCGACSTGSCVSATTLNTPLSTGAFDVSDSTIYWQDDSSTIKYRPIYGGTTVIFAAAQKSVSWITVTPQGLLWSNNGTWNNGMYSGGGVYLNGTSLSAWTNSAQWTGWDGSNFYWVDDGGALRGTPNPQALGAAPLVPNGGYGAAFVGNSVYFANNPDPTSIKKSVLYSGTATTFEAVFGQKYLSPITDGASIFYMITAPVADVGIWKKPISGGAATKLVATNTLGTWISTDGVWIYWFDSTGITIPSIQPQKVMKISVNGGSPIQIGTIIYPQRYPVFNSSCVFGFSGPGSSKNAIVGMEK